MHKLQNEKEGAIFQVPPPFFLCFVFFVVVGVKRVHECVAKATASAMATASWCRLAKVIAASRACLSPAQLRCSRLYSLFTCTQEHDKNNKRFGLSYVFFEKISLNNV